MGERTDSQSGSSVVNEPPRISDHELLRRIGGGSYGEVWLARSVLGELRAVKIIHRSRFQDARPFEREFEGIQRFEPISRSHPSQLAILHVGKNDAAGYFYYVMELADAAEEAEETRGKGEREQFPSASLPLFSPASYTPRTLRHDLEQHTRLPIPDCIQIGLSLTTALAHLHQHGLVHRDIKPSNVIFVNGVPKLGDIGLVTEAGDTQSIVGTEGYIPPEGPGTPQADLFSLGKVLYEISTGLDRRRFPELPDDLRDWPDRNAVTEFNEIVLKACTKDPARRYRSAEAMRGDLEKIATGRSIQRINRRKRFARLAGKLTAFLALLAFVTAGVDWMKNARARSVAQKNRTRTPWEAAGTTNREAWEAVERSDVFVRSYTTASLSNAVVQAERAVILDPRFASAWDQLADASFVSASYSATPARPALERAVAAAENALRFKTEASGTMSGVYLNLARSKLALDYDFTSAEPIYRKALELDDAESWQIGANYAAVLISYSRFNEAENILAKLTVRFPTVWQLRYGLAELHQARGDFDRALQELAEAEQLQPNRWHNYSLRFELFWDKGEHALGARNLVGCLRLKNYPEEELAVLQSTLDRDGAMACLRTHIGQLESHVARGEIESSSRLAILHAYAGNRSRALDCLERAVEHQLPALRAKVHPAFKPLQNEPRFHALLKRLKLE